MPEFRVRGTLCIQAAASVLVEAETEEEACEHAESMGLHAFSWDAERSDVDYFQPEEAVQARKGGKHA